MLLGRLTYCFHAAGSWAKDGSSGANFWERVAGTISRDEVCNGLPLGSPRPHLRQDWAHPAHICAGTGRVARLHAILRAAVPQVRLAYGKAVESMVRLNRNGAKLMHKCARARAHEHTRTHARTHAREHARALWFV